MKPEPQLLRVSVAAHELGWHPPPVRRWVAPGKLASVEVGREARLPRESDWAPGGDPLPATAPVGPGSWTRPPSGPGTARDPARPSCAKAERQGQEPLVLSDLGRGTSTTRSGLARLISQVQEGPISERSFPSPLRLTRFGLGSFERWFAGSGVRLTALEVREEQTPEQEVVEDLLAILASFAGKLYGRRSHKRREWLRCAEHVLSTP